MNEEHKKEEDQRYAGLVAAPWTDISERTALMRELALRPPEIDLRRKSRVGAASPFGEESVAPFRPATSVASTEQRPPIFSPEEAKRFRDRWDAIQADFVDQPRRAVEHADRLVADVMQRLAEVFADERAKIEGPWDRHESESTDNLRIALRRYRSFVGRLLSV
jgi:hypothetical protein